MHFFEIANTAFTIMGYPISYVELIGTVFGLVSVYFASRANMLTWGTGIVNEVFLFLLFFQVHLYADMFLQVYFFVVTLYGWYNWHTVTAENKITSINNRARVLNATIIIGCSLLSGFLIKDLHLYLPNHFKNAASYPYIDSLVMVLSIVATILLAKKKIENWYLWILVDAICVMLYYKKGIYFLSLEYLIFLGLASYGLYHWRKKLING